MPRKATPAPVTTKSNFNEAVAAEATAALNTLAVIDAETSAKVLALATKLNYQGSTDVAALTNSARDAIKRIGMGIFELGAYLLLLKQGCGHGSFGAVLEDLGINPKAAQRYMAITHRFSNASTSTHLEKLGFVKMCELLPLEDDQLDNLVEEGQTGELALDDVATMSVKQLRNKVREARLDKLADEKLLADKNAKLDKLSRRIAKTTPDQVLVELQKEATGFMSDVAASVRGQLRQAFIAIKAHDGGSGDHSRFMSGLIGQLQADLTALRTEFDLADTSNARDQELLAEQAQWANS
jgi:hypothetical protein